MIHMQDMGDRIAERRRSIGWTQGQLAQKLGVTPKAVSKWERGLACPDLLFLDELADALHFSFEALLVGVPTGCITKENRSA